MTFIDLDGRAGAQTVPADSSDGPLRYTNIDHLQWAGDSSRLYGWRSHCSAGVCPHDIIDQLWEFTPGTGEARAVADLGARRDWSAVSGDGSLIYVLTYRFKEGGIAGSEATDASLVVIETASGRFRGQLPLPDVRVGPALAPPPFDDLWSDYSPGVALAPDGSRLYIAHADEDYLTIVDLEPPRVVDVVELNDEQGSGPSRLGSWLRSQFVSEAEANVAQQRQRTMGISRDGTLLFIAGSTIRPCPKDPTGCWHERPTGLMVVDTGTLETVFSESTIEQFEVTPNGRWLVGHGGYQEHSYRVTPPNEAEEGLVGHGLKVLDLRSLSVAHTLWPEQHIRGPVLIDPSSSYAYVRYRAGPPRAGTGCTPDCYTVSVVDLARGVAVAERLLHAGERLLPLSP